MKYNASGKKYFEQPFIAQHVLSSNFKTFGFVYHCYFLVLSFRIHCFHSLIHLFIHSFTHSLIHTFTQSLTHSFIHSSIRLFQCYFFPSFHLFRVIPSFILLTFISTFTQPGPNSTDENLQCFCNHLTSFGGELLPTPNDIDFQEVFIGFASLGNTGNVGVIIAVGVFFLLYIVAVVFARKADRRDEEQVTYLSCHFPQLGRPFLRS